MPTTPNKLKLDALSHYNTEKRVFFRLESGGAVTVIDERQFLAFWQVNKHTTDVREKKIGKIISGLIGVITIKHL